LSGHVLVAGGAGYIGSHVVHALTDAGRSVIVLDDLSTGELDLVPEGVQVVVGDIGDPNLVRSTIDKYECESVYHFAAKIAVAESVSQPLDYYASNVANSIALLRACDQANVGRFVFSSTAAVYDGSKLRPLTESDSIGPSNPYGRTKRMVEEILLDHARASTMGVGILRYFNVAGADPQLRTGQVGKTATHLIKRACQAAAGMLPHIDVFGTDYDTPDGTAIRDYIHASDLAAVHLLLLDHMADANQPTILNCGYGHGFSVSEVLDMVDEVVGKPIKRVVAPRRSGDSASLVANSDEARRVLGWRPEFDDLRVIVETALEWERKHESRGVG
jgi:UDP-glucose 4-epimerase